MQGGVSNRHGGRVSHLGARGMPNSPPNAGLRDSLYDSAGGPDPVAEADAV